MNKDALEAVLGTLGTWSHIFTACVAIGVVGELVVGFWQAGANKRLHEIEALEALSLHKDTEQSRATAESARSEAAQASAHLADAHLEAARANERAAEANRIAEGERLARIKIEERLAPRRLTGQQIVDLSRGLSSFSSTEIQVVFPPDAEPVGIAQPLLAALQAARWSISTIVGHDGARVVTGILVELKPDAEESTGNAAKALADGLRSQNLSVAGPIAWQAMAMGGAFQVSDPQLPNAKIRITIGSK